MASSSSMAPASGNGKEVCAICGDENASRHYGVTACFGCKGFFRRSVKAGLKYICRFDGQCQFDKDKRNTCRFCRLERCLKEGMSATAIRPDRDSTGKQIRRRRNVLYEQRKQANQSPSTSSKKRNRFAQKTLLLQLMSLEYSVTMGKAQKTTDSSYDQMKLANQLTLNEVLENPELVDSERTEMHYDVIRAASADDSTASVRRSFIAALDWVNGIGAHFGITSTAEKLALLKSRSVPLALFSLTARTSQSTTNPDAICLPLGCRVKRNSVNNALLYTLLSQILDDLVAPLNKLSLDEREIVAMKAIIVLDPDTIGLSPTTARSVSAQRDKVLHALFQHISDQFLTNGAASRFGNILSLLPAITNISSFIADNAINVRSFFENNVIDVLLLEILEHGAKKNSTMIEIQYSMKELCVDEETQTDSLPAADEKYYSQEESSYAQIKAYEKYNQFAVQSPDTPLYFPSVCEAVNSCMDQTASPLYYYQHLPVLEHSNLIMQ